MKKILAYLPLLAICWIAFSFAAIVAIVVCPFALVTEHFTYASNVLRTMDRLMASVMGYTGEFTVSTECGTQVRDLQPSECRICTFICRLLERLDPGHCAREAK